MNFCRSRPKQIQPYLPKSAGLELLDRPRAPNTASVGRGPMAALLALDSGLTEGEISAWLEETRLDAILGASSRSHKSVRSGIRCWMAFVGVSQCLCCV